MIKNYFLGLITRCKDERTVAEFCNYYLHEGVDIINIIDDNSDDKSIYNNVLENDRVRIFYECDIIATNYINVIYEAIKDNYEWMIAVDIDEFITTKRNSSLTIREELQNTFHSVDCVKIPWVLMSCNGLVQQPKNVLHTIIYRWNHDKKHPNSVHKFRCRYDKIEVKCIFRCDSYGEVGDHRPLKHDHDVMVVDSIDCKTAKGNCFHKNLREKDIENGYLLCYHYRINSVENAVNKLTSNCWYIQNEYSLADLMSSDHPEIVDYTLRDKCLKY